MQSLARTLSFMSVACSMVSACDRNGDVGTFIDAGNHALGDGGAKDAETDDDPTMPWNDGDSSTDPDGMCPSAHVVAVRERPTLWWIVSDYSLDHRLWFVNGKNWTVGEMLDDLFLAEGGVLSALQSTMNIGALLFSYGDINNNCGSGVELLPTPDNVGALRLAFSEFARSSRATPSSEVAVDRLIRTHLEPVSDGTPTYVLWMVENNTFSDCAGKYPPPPVWLDPVGSSTAPDKALFDNMSRLMPYAEKTFVFTQNAIAGRDTPWDPDYLRKRDDELAKLGGTGHSYGHDLTAENMYEIRDAFRKELSLFVSCSVTLNGEVVAGEECSGEVTIDGKSQPCNDPDGWHMKDERTIELTGKACAGLKERPEAQIKADFPCGVVVLF